MAVHRGELTADVPMFPSPKSQSLRTLPFQDPFSGEFGWCQGVCSVHSGSSSGPRGHHPRAEDDQGKRAQDGEQREAQHPPGVRGTCIRGFHYFGSGLCKLTPAYMGSYLTCTYCGDDTTPHFPSHAADRPLYLGI